jgi:hypothetical protein
MRVAGVLRVFRHERRRLPTQAEKEGGASHEADTPEWRSWRWLAQREHLIPHGALVMAAGRRHCQSSNGRCHHRSRNAGAAAGAGHAGVGVAARRRLIYASIAQCYAMI